MGRISTGISKSVIMEEGAWKKHLGRIVETIAEGILIINPDGRIAFANRAAQKIFGRKQSDIIGRMFNDPMWKVTASDGKSFPDEERPFSRVIGTGRPVYGIELAVERPDGARRILSFNATPLRDERGALVASVETFTDATEHKQAEEERERLLEEVGRTKTYLESILNSSLDLIFTVRKDGTFSYFNPRLEKITGYTPDQIRGRPFLEFIPEHRKELMKEKWVEINKGIAQTYETEIVKADGTLAHVLVSTSVMEGFDEFLVVLKDITERKHAEEVLRESEERFRSLTQSATDAVIACRKQGSIISFWNKAAETIFGYSSEEIIGKPVTDIIPERFREAHKEKVGRLLSTGKGIARRVFESVALRKDGGEFPIELSYGSWRARGELFFVAIVRDITERKRAEEEYMKLARRVQLLLESTDEGIYGLDLEGRCTFINKAGASMIGYKPQEVLGKSMHELIHHSHNDGSPYPPEDCPIQRTCRAGEGVRLDTEVYWRRDGTSFPVEYSSYPIKDGVISGVVVAFTDITERKRAEEALKETSRAIRKAYVDVFSAVTGGRLIITTLEEIEESLGEPVTDTYTITSYEELAPSRMRLREAIKVNFPNVETVEDIVIAASEALTNAIKHAGGGRYRVYKAQNVAQILIADSGPGIDFETLPKATLLAGYSTKPSLGIGFSMMLEFSDRILLSTQPGNTTIVLEKRFG